MSIKSNTEEVPLEYKDMLKILKNKAKEYFMSTKEANNLIRNFRVSFQANYNFDNSLQQALDNYLSTKNPELYN